MHIPTWLTLLPQFLILLPSAASCYLPIPNQLKYTSLQTAALCGAVLLPFCLLGSWLSSSLSIPVNWILFPSLTAFFFLYRLTITTNLPQSLAIYVGVCAIETFPGQLAYSFDAWLHPDSGAAAFSLEASFFQLGFSCLLFLGFFHPARHRFSWILDHLEYSRIWYATLPISILFFSFNVIAIPISYSTLHTGRMGYLFPLLEFGAMVLLIAIYVLFYQCAMVMQRHHELEKRSQLLEMQAHQYQTLQEHMRQTSRQRHDFRHSIHLLTALAGQGDLESIQAHLAEYENRLAEAPPIRYCSNAALNALLGYYQEMAALAGIETVWNIELPDPLRFSELDMAGLFGNLMENAIAGCQTLPEGTRYFSLTTELRPGNSLYIVSTNSFDGKVKKGKDGYRSTKHGGRGTGLASIAAVAEKYQGTARISNNEKEFFVDIVLKLG